MVKFPGYDSNILLDNRLSENIKVVIDYYRDGSKETQEEMRNKKKIYEVPRRTKIWIRSRLYGINTEFMMYAKREFAPGVKEFSRPFNNLDKFEEIKFIFKNKDGVNFERKRDNVFVIPMGKVNDDYDSEDSENNEDNDDSESSESEDDTEYLSSSNTYTEQYIIIIIIFSILMVCLVVGVASAALFYYYNRKNRTY